MLITGAERGRPCLCIHSEADHVYIVRGREQETAVGIHGQGLRAVDEHVENKGHSDCFS